MKEKTLLKRIKICGFKSLGTAEQPVDLELNHLNIIIGANGAGKSNLPDMGKEYNWRAAVG